LPRFQWYDQNEQLVDIYDFAKQGNPVVLDISTVWCGWCRVMAAWLDGDMSEAQSEIDAGYDFEGFFSGEDWWDLVPELVANEEIYWVTAITQNAQGGAAKQKDVKNWAEDFPNEKVPVLLDEEAALEDFLNVSGFPTLFMLDENLEFTVVERGDYTAVLTQLVEDYGS
jgi:thiol-disulfide isomerase/thioredoxin